MNWAQGSLTLRGQRDKKEQMGKGCWVEKEKEKEGEKKQVEVER